MSNKIKVSNEQLKAIELHMLFVKLGVSQATLIFEDGIGYEYTYISKVEFQLNMVGNMPSNYVLENK